MKRWELTLRSRMGDEVKKFFFLKSAVKYMFQEKDRWQWIVLDDLWYGDTTYLDGVYFKEREAR